MTTKQKDDQRAKDQAKAQLESILEMVAELNKAEEAEDENWTEQARETIQEDPLSVQVRGGWRDPGDDQSGADEFCILLCTGGPACRIVGDLGQYGEPDSASIEYQDWFTPWERMPLTSEEEEAVLTYCQQFYFGE